MFRFVRRSPEYFLLSLVLGFLLFQALRGFHNVAWGTGAWLGGYSIKWTILFFGYIIVSITSFVFAVLLIWNLKFSTSILAAMLGVRNLLGPGRFLLAGVFFLAPIYFFQFTVWGLVFHDIYIRISAWAYVATVVAFLVEYKKDQLFSWKTFLWVVFLTSSMFVASASFLNVTNYPFSLSWSEGNRMWDYSILFGRERYDYPANKDIFVLLDISRQFVGGLPFLFPSLTIGLERFWLALTVLLPYLLLGVTTFRFFKDKPKYWALGSLWVLIFLKQGPIHPPLIFCAIFVSLVWLNPIWVGVPVIFLTGCFAHISRFTWLFAPGMWIVMLELGGGVTNEGRLTRRAWVRAILLGIAGVLGGYFGPDVVTEIFGKTNLGLIGLTSVATITSSQSLLWYRLLPNATYGVGIIVGLMFAVLPSVMVLIYLVVSKKWVLNVWQQLAIYLPLLAFLVAGLVISTKIGGGGDLHNMDMFLIGLMFAGSLALKYNGVTWFLEIDRAASWIQILLLSLVVLPGLQSLGDIRSHDFAEDASWLITLTDAPDTKALDMYPSNLQVELALSTIRENIEGVQADGGEVLFIDQRQLITFGYIKVKLLPEYEKKLLMEMALNNNAMYFKDFYSDLRTHRFALIVSEILRTPIKDSTYQFGEENNAWVKWVSIPTLCYYEEKGILKDVGVQLLVPKNESVNCDSVLP
jgi:hypothetical protein